MQATLCSENRKDAKMMLANRMECTRIRALKAQTKRSRIIHVEMYIHLPSGIYLLDRIYKGDEVVRNTIDRLAFGNHALHTKKSNIPAFCLGYPPVEISCLCRSHTRRHLARIGAYDRFHFGIGWKTRILASVVPVVQAADYSIRLKSIASSLLGLLEVRRTDWAGPSSLELLVN